MCSYYHWKCCERYQCVKGNGQWCVSNEWVFHRSSNARRGETLFVVYVQCASHRLHLAISDACDEPAIWKCMSILRNIMNFFNTQKRLAALIKVIDDRPGKFPQHDYKNSTRTDASTVPLATHLLLTVRTAEFQCVVYSIATVSAVTLNLNKLFQTEYANFRTAMVTPTKTNWKICAWIPSNCSPNTK